MSFHRVYERLRHTSEITQKGVSVDHCCVARADLKAMLYYFSQVEAEASKLRQQLAELQKDADGIPL